MDTASLYKRIALIRTYGRGELLELWEQVKDKSTPSIWNPGRAFELLVLRAFELEGAEVSWPYQVDLLEMGVLEEVDGLIQIHTPCLTVLVECKDLTRHVNAEPITHVRSKLQRRPSSVIGAVFVTSEFTAPARLQAHFMFPQTILLWDREDVEYCLRTGSFVQGMVLKHKWCMERGAPAERIEILMEMRGQVK